MTEKRKPKVFIPSKVEHDYKAALEYGEVVTITSGRVDRYNVGELHSTILKALEDAQEEDTILVSGFTLSNCIASAIMAHRFGVVNFLLYRRGEYMMRRVILGSGNGRPSEGQILTSSEEGK